MRTPRRAMLAIALAFGALAMASMASATTTPNASVERPDATCGAETPSGDPDTPVSSCPQSPVEPVPLDPSIVLPAPGMDNVHPTSFDTATIGDDDRTLTITFWSGVEPCYVLDRVDLAYGADTVTVTLFQGSDTSAVDVACIDIALLKQVTVRLDQPLAGRTLVDGATN